MNRSRFFAAIFVLVALAGAVALALTLDSEYRPQMALAQQPFTTTTTEPDFDVLVESATSPTLSEEELQLTEEAVARATSTTSPSTTTTSTLGTSTTAPAPTDEQSTDARPQAATPAPSPSEDTAKTTAQTTPPTTAPPTTAPPTTSPPTTAAAGGYVSGAESDFASKINSFRSSNGQSGLSRSGSLDSYARSWAKKMAQSGGLSHSNIGSLLPPWSSAGENVGVGGSVGSIFDALVGSSGHRSNMLGDFTHMGVGVYQASDGSLWTAHVFTR